MAFSEYTDYHKLEGPIQNVMYNSVKHKSNHKLIDIPLLRLDDRHSSQDSNEFTEKSRAISHSTIYTNNNKTGCIELVKDKKTSKLFSPDNQPTYERCFNRQPFSHMVKTKMKFPNKISTQIMEEDSSSMSPDVSFKKVKSNFVKNQTTRVHKEYLESEDGLFEKVSHETIYHYDKNELVRRVISAEIQSKANEIASQEMDAKYFSFKDERRNPALLPPEERVEITQDFTDSSFNFMNNVTKKSPSKNVNNYLRSGRSKTYKEDDSDYFQVNEAIVNLKKDSMQSPDKSMSKCSAKN